MAIAQAASATPAAPRIVVVVAPVASYVGALTQNVAPAQNLMQPGQDPHHFTLAPSQERMLDNADMIIIPALSMSPAIAAVAKAHPKLKIIELSTLAGASPLPYEEENPWLAAAPKEKTTEDIDPPLAPETRADGTKKLPDFDAPEKVAAPVIPTVDPHFWLDPERMAALAPALATAIGEYAPAYKATLQTNAKTLGLHLRREVMPEMHALLKPHGTRHTMTTKLEIPFITYHAAYQYFLLRFHLAHTGEITARPEDYLGAKTLDGLMATAKKVHIHCLIGETNTSFVERLAGLAGAKVVTLSPEQNIGQNDVPPLPWMQTDYDRLLYQTAKSFGDCL